MRWPAKCLRISLPMTRTSLRRCTYSDSLALCWLTPWPASTGCGTAARKTASQRSGPKIATESAYAKQKKPGTPKSTGPILILSATACNLNRSSNVSGNLGSRLSEGIHVRDVVEVVGDVVDLCLSFSTAGNMGNDDTGTSWHEQLWPFLTNDVSLPGCASPPSAKKPPKRLAMPPKKPPMPLRNPPLLLPGVVLPVVVAPPRPNNEPRPPRGRAPAPAADRPAICTKSAFDAVEPSAFAVFRPNKPPSLPARPLSALRKTEPKRFASRLCPIALNDRPLPVTTNCASC